MRSGDAEPAPPGFGEAAQPVPQDAKIAGVCAGIARYFGLDVSLVRILSVVLAFYPPGGGLLAYIICWIVMPRDPLPAHASMGAVKSTA